MYTEGLEAAAGLLFIYPQDLQNLPKNFQTNFIPCFLPILSDRHSVSFLFQIGSCFLQEETK